MFSIIPNIKNRKTISEFTSLVELVNYIKSDKRDEIELIKQARKFGKGSKEYNEIKKNQLPCVVINFNHSESYINGSTVSEPTGYMYLDIDDSDMSNIDLKYICTYWRSLSNNGYSLIAKVNGLNRHNLKDAYRFVGNLLDIKYDTAAVSVDRLTVLSHDPDAEINHEALTIDIPQKETHFSSIKILNYDYDCNGSKIRYDDLDTQLDRHRNEIVYDRDGIYDFGENKILYHKAYIPHYKVKKGNRNKRMSSFIHQMIWLNKSYDKNKLFNFFYVINQDKLSPPLSKERIKNLFYSKYLKRDDLVPMANATRRFIYNPDFVFTTKQKRVLNAIRIGKDKIKKSKQKIRKCLLEWDSEKLGKITNKKVAKETGQNIKTVNNYCKEVKTELGLI